MIAVVPLDPVPPQRWRNGGGTTRELLAWPSANDWRLRISVAEILQDGPFSAFPGIDRWFAVVEGAGVVLRFTTHRAMLGIASDPLHFDGAAAPGCELQDGATRDLNLMARRDAGQARMQRALPGEDWVSPAPLRALFCATPARLQIDAADAARLPAMALAWSDHAGDQRWRVCGDAESPRAFWLSFQPTAR